MKRRWRVVMLRAKGEILGDVEALMRRRQRWPPWPGLISTKPGARGSSASAPARKRKLATFVQEYA